MSDVECRHDPDACDCEIVDLGGGSFSVTLPDRSITYTRAYGFHNGIITITMANGYTYSRWEDED